MQTSMCGAVEAISKLPAECLAEHSSKILEVLKDTDWTIRFRVLQCSSKLPAHRLPEYCLEIVKLLKDSQEIVFAVQLLKPCGKFRLIAWSRTPLKFCRCWTIPVNLIASQLLRPWPCFIPITCLSIVRSW